jgi:hypothetical protein
MTECEREHLAALSHTGVDQHGIATECALSATTNHPHSLKAPTELPLSAAFCTPLGVQAHSVALVVHLPHSYFAMYKNQKPRPATSHRHEKDPTG